ncbi:MAG: tRNA (guanosine(37)-N1)-methyltransferase TrmD [Bacteroidia bacterium]|nr:tRNA (guanosine(37)-N1)-methyltransferase TrmD [Bacteroidia bacterium]MDW8417222.1 tRNA (guanosine(37)-N1)-methyltransferase TrmD [Bacteroidia bacterium]
MHIDVLTAVPEVFTSPLESSILRRAREKQLLSVAVHNLHHFSPNGRIDDYPYGGGAGMVIRVDVVVRALRYLQSKRKYDEVIYLTADGMLLSQSLLNQLSMHRSLLLIAGHYKGIDDRIRHYISREISIGNYVLTGGELPALVLIDGIARLLPGVLSDGISALEDSYQDGLLAPPLYTRPPEFEGHKVPEVLLSGDHKAICKWRHQMSWQRTLERRPELIREDEAPPPEYDGENAAQRDKSVPASEEEGPS